MYDYFSELNNSTGGKFKYRRHVPTSKTVGYVKLRLAVREIPNQNTDDDTTIILSGDNEIRQTVVGNIWDLM